MNKVFSLIREEVAERFIKKQNFNSLEIDDKIFEAILFGAKWQQEKDKNKYSEEDMNEYADYVLMCSAEKTFKLPLPPKEWFEQFKKK